MSGAGGQTSSDNSAGVEMRAPLAATAADRISHSAILVAGALCGALVFFVAVPLALSNPFPAPKEGERAVHRSSIKVASLIPVSVAIEEQALLDPLPSIPEPTLWDFVALPAHTGSPGFKPPQVPRTAFTASIVEEPPQPRRAGFAHEE